jgi:RNA polymerase sigma-70 factor (ECF subfamily)
VTQAASDLHLTDLRRRLSQAVFRVCPGWLSTHAEDIVQTAMLRVLDAAGKRGEGDPDLSSLYVEKAAYSATVDEIRRHRRRREGPAMEENSIQDGAAAQADPETLTASREIAAGIGHCLSGLSSPRRLAVTLHLQGHSVSEVAALMRWRFKKSENLVYRGLADLRRCLATKGLGR